MFKSTGIASKLSKRQNTDQSLYVIICVSQAFGSVNINVHLHLHLPGWNMNLQFFLTFSQIYMQL